MGVPSILRKNYQTRYMDMKKLKLRLDKSPEVYECVRYKSIEADKILIENF